MAALMLCIFGSLLLLCNGFSAQKDELDNVERCAYVDESIPSTMRSEKEISEFSNLKKSTNYYEIVESEDVMYNISAAGYKLPDVLSKMPPIIFANCKCCQTIYKISRPTYVSPYGFPHIKYPVVTFGNSFQSYFNGVCVDHGMNCCGKKLNYCAQVYRTDNILIRRRCRYEFVQIRVANHCECTPFSWIWY